VSGAAPSNEPCLLDEDDIPDVVDGESWQKHEHLFDWRGGKLRLQRHGTPR
jgi:hypothetical protein